MQSQRFPNAKYGLKQAWHGLVSGQRLVLHFLLALLIFSAPAISAEDHSYRELDSRVCPLLDMPFFAHEGIYCGFIPEVESSAIGWGDVAAIELGGWVRIVNWENSWGGDLDIQAQWDTMMLYMGEPSEVFPLSMGRLFFQWSQRYEGGFGFELDASPGL